MQIFSFVWGCVGVCRGNPLKVFTSGSFKIIISQEKSCVRCPGTLWLLLIQSDNQFASNTEMYYFTASHTRFIVILSIRSRILRSISVI